MDNICPVCDIEIASKELLYKHVQEHINESTLGKIKPNELYEKSNTRILNGDVTPQINLENIFSTEIFEKLTKLKKDSIIVDSEILKRQNFIELIKRINLKNPFLYIPYFIKDFMGGMASRDLQDKYHILHSMDSKIVTHDILGFKENRYLLRRYENCLELNLKNIHWNDKYLELEDNCKFFKDELDELVFNNALQAGIIFLLMDKELDQSEILQEMSEIKKYYVRHNFVDNNLVNKFNQILEINLNKRIENILIGLKREGVIKRSEKGSRKLITTFNIDKIQKKIIRELVHDDKLRYTDLRNLISNQFPGLRLIPKFGIFEASWKELEKDGKLAIEYQSSRNNDFVLFLTKYYDQLEIDIHNIDTEQKKYPFVGRKIDPDQFILELLELDKGDFDDADDQVTRMAGLVLAESVNIQSPHEEIQDFDFTVDLQNYDFRPEQIEAIGKLDFRPHDGKEFGILHVKVMIGEKLSFTKYLELKNKIPSNEQGTIITFRKISDQIKNDMKNDSTIQIIDEEGVKTWVSITPQIPARVNSVSKITYDPLSKLEHKIVKVNSVFYETGIALVNVFPEMNEVTVLARTLEEIPLFVEDANNFNELADHYSNFLTILFTTSTYDDVIDGIFKNKFNDESKNLFFKIEFDYNTVELVLNGSTKHDIFNCNCIKYAENNLKFCTHLVSTLDYIFRYTSKQNKLRDILGIWIKENISIILDKLEITKENYDNKEISDFIRGKFKILTDF